MRTSHSSTRSVAGLSLTDFTRAVNAAGLGRSEAPVDVATSLAPSIPQALLASAVETLEAALAGRHPSDPLLGGSLSRLVSAVNAAVKRSGPLIEKALVAALEQSGYVVLRHVAMGVSEAAMNLVAYNEMRDLRGVSVTADAPADGPVIIYDLLVYCPKTRRAMLLEVKRGNGMTELRKIRPMTRALQAGSLQVKAQLKALGYKVRSVDAKLVDYYGHSGFSDAVRLTGKDLDRYFGVPVRGLIEAVLGEMRARLFAALPGLLAHAMAEAAQGPEPARRTITLPNGIRVAPEHVRQIELPPRRKGKAKLVQVITIAGRRPPGGQPAATVQ